AAQLPAFFLFARDVVLEQVAREFVALEAHVFLQCFSGRFARREQDEVSIERSALVIELSGREKGGGADRFTARIVLVSQRRQDGKLRLAQRLRWRGNPRELVRTEDGGTKDGARLKRRDRLCRPGRDPFVGRD